ncbi:transglutaminase-like domain-containing protein [Aestuariimicrobium ganziense]|uniref:transglutaminase-like domain-containing protein n=1 Tax=Aestuariimicrobium ganziense TaxID=2773677 RepID=UPI0019407806|nr:transglutaminase family protein [Aestuariimicrobium ganziense]
MRLRIHSTLTHTFSQPVRSRLQVRLAPAATARQLVLSHPLSVEPSGFSLTYDDYWSTRVTELEVAEEHTRFQVSMLSDVNVTSGPFRPLATDFSRVDAAGVEDAFHEFLQPGPLTGATDETRELAVELRSASGNPAELVERLSQALVSAESDDERTHLTIGALRAAGVPARFVSGYRAPFESFDQSPELGTAAAGVITSWIDYWDGAWHGWDPTTAQVVGERHVIIGWGRDRKDCPPLRTIYTGGGDAECDSEILVTRLS